jgi:ubiquinone/menaquinone biosynthesis C-methylase UbiE
VELDQAKQAMLDNELVTYSEEIRRDPTEKSAVVTLAYTHGLHGPWRNVVRMLPVAPNWSVLDVGSGLGILALELAGNLPVTVSGVDIEPRFVAHANELHRRLDALGYFAPGGHVRFSQGDINALDMPDDAADLVFVRELLQFLPDPLAAVREIFRVVRPGQFACVGDIDDQLYITWPPPSSAQERLVGAFRSLHHQRGGDRQVGRKLSTYLSQAGFLIDSIVVLPEAQHRVVDASDTERTLILAQLQAARDSMINSQAMSESEFDLDIAELSSETAHEEFRMNARIIVLARKPADESLP